MTELIVTGKDLDKAGYYKDEHLVNIEGSITVESDLGVVRVRGKVIAQEALRVGAGTGIEAGGEVMTYGSS